jgi:hypothetical protein
MASGGGQLLAAVGRLGVGTTNPEDVGVRATMNISSSPSGEV